MSTLDPGSPVPLYFQLKQLILEHIERGELKPGDQVPTESELCERYGVSRTPVRQALLELTREGVLSRQAGRGTFVRPPSDNPRVLRVMVPDERWRGPLDEAAARRNRVRSSERLELEISVVPLAELHDRLVLAVGQGRAPDIAVVDTVWVAEFAHRHYLFPLDELDAAWAQEVRQGFYPPLLAACQHQGALQAVPANADATVLWYRRDWLAAEGLGAPANWAELLAVGRHFRRPEVRRRYGLGAHPLSFVGGRAGGETTTYQLLPLLWAAGGDLIAGGEVVLDSAPARKALAFLRQLVQQEEIASPGVTELPWNGALLDLAEGRAALAFGGTYENFLIQAAASWDAPTFGEWVGFVPLPTGPAGRAPTIVGGMGYAITHQCRFPEEALALLRLALSPEVLGRFSLATGQNAAHVAVGQTVRRPEQSFLERAAALFPGARARPSLPAYDRVSAQFQELVELAIAGHQPLPELLRRAAERISGISGLPSRTTEQAA